MGSCVGKLRGGIGGGGSVYDLFFVFARVCDVSAELSGMLLKLGGGPIVGNCGRFVGDEENFARGFNKGI